jgi:hypothetical protein
MIPWTAAAILANLQVTDILACPYPHLILRALRRTSVKQSYAMVMRLSSVVPLSPNASWDNALARPNSRQNIAAMEYVTRTKIAVCALLIADHAFLVTTYIVQMGNVWSP